MADKPLFQRILVANRGEIALRVIRTAQEMGIETVAVYSDADRNALHVRRADRAVRIGPPAPRDSYLRIDAILEAARAEGCDAVHPGYGFLSENARFSAACEEAGLVFLGPAPRAIAAMGDKVEARKLAAAAGVPLVPGLRQEARSDAELVEQAQKVGFPVMLKAAAGGGGKGIRIVHHEKDLLGAAQLARAEAKSAFADERIYLEKYLARPRHVEVQVMADRHGGVVAYGERECSVQRRHQKLVEESPCPVLTAEMRAAMCRSACDLARAVGYLGAGTVEFLWSEGNYYFMEMNTRLQVEHPITEMRFGVDLVREQIRVAAGLPVAPVPEPRGHAIEIRVNAEDPDSFLPSLGRISRLHLPGGPGVRLDSALYRGLEVTPHYDSMLAKLVVHAPDRAQAIARAIRALRETRVLGVATVIPAALRALESEAFRSGDYDTGILERITKAPPEPMREVAMLAAAVARFLNTGGPRVAPAGDDAAGALSPWVLAERMERLGRRPR
ncbi:MAG: acetyl-CoA carboxylase biotin carboxylase subunit [Planctomycetes bacterium]|nr:acetyl-CoA carboxylase biotin carboxylase subunit [Planctomycetota bacterium]